MTRGTTRNYYTTTLTTSKEYLVREPNHQPQDADYAISTTATDGHAVNDDNEPFMGTKVTQTVTTQYSKTKHRRHEHNHHYRDRQGNNNQKTHRPVERSSPSGHRARSNPYTTKSAENIARDLGQTALMQDSTKWTVEQVEDYFNRMTCEENETALRACHSPIPDQSAVLLETQKSGSNKSTPKNSSSSSKTLKPEALTAEEAARQRGRFDVPESIHPLRVFQSSYKDHLDTNNEYSNRFDKYKTQFPTLKSKSNGSRPLSRNGTGGNASVKHIPEISKRSEYDLSRDEVYRKHMNTLHNLKEAEGKIFFKDIVKNRIAEVDNKINKEVDMHRRLDYIDLKKDYVELKNELR